MAADCAEELEGLVFGTMCSHLVLRSRQLAHAIGTRRRRLGGFEASSGAGVEATAGSSCEDARILWSPMADSVEVVQAG